MILNSPAPLIWRGIFFMQESKMRQEIADHIAKELKDHKDLINKIRAEMIFLREQSGLSYEEISYLSGCCVEKIKAQENGASEADLTVISPVVLIYYMFVFDIVPTWLHERLFLFRNNRQTVW